MSSYDQTHWAAREVVWQEHRVASTLLAAIEPPSEDASLVVFVHGFQGHVTGSWSRFPSLIRRNSRFRGVDCIFYKYESTQPIGTSGLTLLHFLDEFLDAPADHIGRALGSSIPRREQSFAYSKIFLVGHSLGAVVIRYAQMESRSRDDNCWSGRERTLLFAPAHSGMRIGRLISEAFSEFLSWEHLIQIEDDRYPVLEDLVKESPLLTQLKKDINRAVNEHEAHHLIPEVIVHARNDYVADSAAFIPQDPEAQWEPGRTHKDVCQPTTEYAMPVEKVAALL